MVVARLWNFVKRHKKKFIGTAVLCGGGYVAWKVLKSKFEDYMLKSLMKQMEGGDLLKELMGEKEEDPQKEEERKRAKFEHNQQVSDSHTQKCLAVLQERLQSCFAMDESSRALTLAQNKEEKLRCMTTLQVECLARAVSAMYALHLLLILHRVEFNIVGREMMGTDGKDDTLELTAFVESVSYVQGDGLPRICDAVREAVKACWADDIKAPLTKVNAERLRSFLLNVCHAADTALLEGSNGPTTLLPESLDDPATPKVKQLLDETRDYVESPQFLDVFRSVLAGALTHFVDSLGEVSEQTEPPKPPPLPSNTAVPIARLGGDCVTRSQAMLASDDGAGYVTRFAEDPLVTKLCEALYFEETKTH